VEKVKNGGLKVKNEKGVHIKKKVKDRMENMTENYDGGNYYYCVVEVYKY
jgi:hypothetical protein